MYLLKFFRQTFLQNSHLGLALCFVGLVFASVSLVLPQYQQQSGLSSEPDPVSVFFTTKLNPAFAVQSGSSGSRPIKASPPTQSLLAAFLLGSPLSSPALNC